MNFWELIGYCAKKCEFCEEYYNSYKPLNHKCDRIKKEKHFDPIEMNTEEIEQLKKIFQKVLEEQSIGKNKARKRRRVVQGNNSRTKKPNKIIKTKNKTVRKV